MSVYQRFKVSQSGDVSVLRLVDRELSDLVLQDDFFNELQAFIKDQRPAKLVVNFGTVQYCTTGTINSLISAKKRMLEYHGALRLCCLSHNVHVTLKALNLEGTVFDISPTEEDAIAAISQ